MSHTAKNIHAFIQTLQPIYKLLLPFQTTVRERMSLGIHCFEQAPELVRDTAAVLRDSGELLPETRTNPEVLADEQEDADAMRDLQAHLQFLGQLSAGAVLALQARTSKAAMAVYHDALAYSRFVPRHQQRLRRLALARIAIDVPRQHRHRPRAGEQAAPAPAAPEAKDYTESP